MEISEVHGPGDGGDPLEIEPNWEDPLEFDPRRPDDYLDNLIRGGGLKFLPHSARLSIRDPLWKTVYPPLDKIYIFTL